MKLHTPQNALTPALAFVMGSLMLCSGVQGQTVTPFTITSGFNADLIAEGSGDAQFSTTDTLDNNYVFYDSTYAAAHGIGSGALSAGETITGALTGNTYTLAAAAGNNVLDLKGNDFTSGTLNLAPVSGVESLDILCTGGDGGGNVGYTLNFSNGSTQTGTINIPDWVGGGASSAEVSGLDVVFRSQNTLLGQNIINLYDAPIAVDSANQSLTLDSISFSWPGSGEEGIFAVSGVSTAAVPEASSYVMVLCGLGTFLGYRRMRKS